MSFKFCPEGIPVVPFSLLMNEGGSFFRTEMPIGMLAKAAGSPDEWDECHVAIGDGGDRLVLEFTVAPKVSTASVKKPTFGGTATFVQPFMD